MNTNSDSSKPSELKKRSASPRQESDSPLSKQSKVDDEKDREIDSSQRADKDVAQDKYEDSPPDNNSVVEGDKQRYGGGTNGTQSTSDADGGSDSRVSAKEGKLDALTHTDEVGDAAESENGCQPSTSHKEQSDSAAIAAAEALASLTGVGDVDDDSKEMPCSSKQAFGRKLADKFNRPSCSKESTKPERGQHAEAAAADSSSSLLNCAEREDEEQVHYMDEEDDSLPGSSSTASSSIASDNDDNEDGECAIVSVKMAPEVRQSVALLAQVQMRLDALEKKGARLHQRLEMKMGRQRRPHLDQRGAITQTIPGFWVTALLNHPHLSAHIDENDEDALSYMTNLEIETFKNNKLGYRICFHFRRNPFFQNKVIVKELHLGMGGSPVSFSNPILWHRGQNLTGNGESRRTSRGVYQSFFHWFSDHSSPGGDDIAQILKDDLYRNPLRYYLTPLWEPRENGSTPKPPDNSNGDECVIISDSDDDQEVVSQDQCQEPEEEVDDGGEDNGQVAGSDDSEQEAGEYSLEEREEEEVDVEEVDESRDSSGCEVRGQGLEEEEDIDINEDVEEEAEDEN
ncbi:testis specific protein Y-linked [Electrophorus electricus]|uniref:Testis specific protein Y-linked n=1 Tax=Electrophorus electricus TaxID=8005 RepID=A0A4W4G027_ELEEL|nr:testis specific protein Y-linked [Electrophorus electricus]